MEALIKKLQKETTKENINSILSVVDINIIKQIVKKCDNAYHNTNKTLLSDVKYDILLDFLKENTLFEHTVGANVNTKEKVKLPVWMGSMNKIKEQKEIDNWVNKNKHSEYIIQPKLDGIACLFCSKNRKLYTRGNGEYGLNISRFLKYLNCIPSETNDLLIRGELIIRKDIYEKKYSKTYSNPRNMVSGIFSSKTYKKEILDIDFIAFEIINRTALSPLEQLTILKQYKFKVIDYYLDDKLSKDNLSSSLLNIKDTINYEIDGLIVQPNKKYIRNKDSNPSYAFAFKIAYLNCVKAEVLDVEWNASKWNILKPRIKIKPVVFNGVNINYASGFNAKFIKEKEIGKGAIVNITRSGDVIPFIVEVVKKGVVSFPSIEYKWNDTNVDIITTETTNNSKIKTIHYFFSAIGAKNIGIKIIEKLYNNGYTNIFKILKITENELTKLDGFQEKLANNIYNTIQTSISKLDIITFIYSYGCFGEGFGKKKIQKLFEYYPNILNDYNVKSSEYISNKILNIPGFSQKSIEKILNNLERTVNITNSFFGNVTINQKEKTNEMKNQIVVFSGFRDKKLEETIKNKGGDVKSSVSSKTTLVIYSGKTTSKVEKAKELNIPVVLREKFSL